MLFLDYSYLVLEHLFLYTLFFFLFQDPMLEIFFAFSLLYLHKSLVLEYLVAFIFLFFQIPWPIWVLLQLFSSYHTIQALVLRLLPLVPILVYLLKLILLDRYLLAVSLNSFQDLGPHYL